ncbi:MAG TPA: Mu transposase C-terminal domain-containing protein [Phycisphaerae bacterium]|nr:Mu transposase C-terminal domain-containing protein [Phycisphaerae bacterium]
MQSVDNAFVSVSDAARLTGVSERNWRWRCANDLAARALARKVNGAWFVCRKADPKLAAQPDRIARDQLADLSRYPVDYVATAQIRLRWVRLLERVRRDHDTDAAALAAVVAQAASADPPRGSAPRHEPPPRRGFGARTLRAWRDAYARGGLLALVPKYQSRSVLPSRDREGAANCGPVRSAEAVVFFESLYLTERRLSVALCHEMTLHEAGRKDWSWPVSCDATRKWLARHGDKGRACLMRHGYEYWAHRYMPSIEQANERVEPGRLFVADTKTCDFWVRVDRGKAVRPHLVAVQDIGSRVIVGYDLCVGGNQDTILAALRRAFVTYAVPDTIKLDNGRDYTAQLFHGFTRAQCRRLRAEFGRDWRRVVEHESKQTLCDAPAWKGLLPELGIRVIFAGAYEPQAKATIERFFGTLDERCAKLLPGYCGRSPDQRTDALEAARCDVDRLLTLDEARQRVSAWIDGEYHQRPHSSLGGLTPQQRWKTAGRLRQADAAALDLMLSIRGTRRVRANGVEVKVGGASIRFGQFDPNLRKYAGRDVLVAWDSADASFVLCFDARTRRLICRALPNRRIDPDATGQDLREASRDLAVAKRDARRARDSAGKRLKTVERLASEAANRKHAGRLAATGTDDHRAHGSGARAPDATLAPVRTGFEGVSVAPRSEDIFAPPQVVAPPHVGLDLSDWVDDDKEEEGRRNEVPGRDEASFTDDDDTETELDSVGGDLVPAETRASGTGLEDWDDEL